MIPHLPVYISLVFGLTTLIAVWLFYRATQASKRTLLILLVWMLLQMLLGLAGFYQKTDGLPPRLPSLLIPPLVLIIGLLVTSAGRRFLDSLRFDRLTMVHVVRVPVEIVLFWLFMNKAVPQVMTFEGRNVDILAGLTAPLVYYFGFVTKQLSRSVLLGWNLICLGLLANIVITAILAVPSPFQQLAFGQPNVAILYFPFVWLPSTVVPLVLLSHITAIRRLL